MVWVSVEADDKGKAFAEGIEKELAADITSAVKVTTERTKQNLRRATAGGWKSTRLPTVWRGHVYPQYGDSMSAAGSVEVAHTAVHIIESSLKATVIRSQNRTWLALPTTEVRRFMTVGDARKRLTPKLFEQETGMKLRFIPEPGGRRIFLGVDQAMMSGGLPTAYRSTGRGSKKYGPSGKTIIMFVMVRYVRTEQRLDLDRLANEAANTFADLIVSTNSG